MENNTKGNVKERILKIATELFSKKGYEGAKMSEIAKVAGVNKALIYYYFPGKQSILDHLIDSFFSEMTNVVMSFILETITRMIKEERLDILNDRYRFRDKDSMQEFRTAMFGYCEDLLTMMLKMKDMLRIIMAESLRESNQQDALYRFFLLIDNNDRNPLYQKVYEADSDVYYSRETIFREFFFYLTPILTLTVYYDSYKTLSGLDDDAMKKAYLNSLQSMWAGNFSEFDLIIDINLLS